MEIHVYAGRLLTNHCHGQNWLALRETNLIYCQLKLEYNSKKHRQESKHLPLPHGCSTSTSPSSSPLRTLFHTFSPHLSPLCSTFALSSSHLPRGAAEGLRDWVLCRGCWNLLEPVWGSPSSPQEGPCSQHLGIETQFNVKTKITDTLTNCSVFNLIQIHSDHRVTAVSVHLFKKQLHFVP